MGRTELLESSLAHAIELLEDQLDMTEWDDDNAAEAVALYEEVDMLRDALLHKDRVYQ